MVNYAETQKRENKSKVGLIKKEKNIFLSAAILTGISLLIKGEGMIFRSYLSARIGSEGMGLYQLIMSVYSLFATFATSGFTVAISRLVSEKRGVLTFKEGESTSRRILHMGLLLALGISIFASVLLMTLSPFIATYILKDGRTAKPLFILGFSMVFMAVSACIKGYLLGSGQIYKPSMVSLYEQTVKITVIVFFFKTYLKTSTALEDLCIGIVSGLSLGEFSSFLLLVVMYIWGKSKETPVLPVETRKESLLSVSRVTMPIAGSAYTSSILHTVESILIPAMMEIAMGSKSDALSSFGIIRGMAIPALFFPFSFLSAVVSVAIPQISGTGNKEERHEKIQKIMKTVTVYSIPAGSVFFFFSKEIATLFYGNYDSANCIKLLALVTPFMYIETVSDGLLKSIGEEAKVFRYGLYNSVFRLIFIMLFLKNMGEQGFILMLILSNTFSFLLCFLRLKKVSKFKLNFIKSFLFPFLASAVLCFGVAFVFRNQCGVRWDVFKIVLSVLLYVPIAVKS